MNSLFSLAFVLFYFGLSYIFIYFFFGNGFLLDFYLFCVGGMDVTFSVVFDFLSAGFFGCVALISGLVFLYSNFYMGDFLDSRRFSYLVFLFVISMFFLVFSGSFFLTMIGWDGLGLVSFCLVIFYSNSVSLDSGLLTVFSNRVGDVFFLICFFFFSVTGWWNFDSVVFGDSFLLGLLIFMGAITKSAQIPFSAWLPAAMAAPTPVSSLVHSSTLVTAGLYILIRFHHIFFSNFWFLKAFGISTMFLAGMCACVEKDFKKIIAMSTLSQLGMMVYILSIGMWSLSFLHMMTHAFFKSMLFLSSGSLISHNGGGQDSRFYGGERWSLGSYLYFVVSCFGLSGFPFIIGFYSKDSMLGGVSGSFSSFFYVIFLFSCGLTIVYSLRLVVMGYKFGVKGFVANNTYEDYSFLASVYLLFLVCCFSGGGLSWFFLSGLEISFRGFDYLIGVLLIVAFSSFSFYLGKFGFLSSFLGGIFFLVWISTAGLSSFLKSFLVHSGESSWLEMAGGQGMFKVIGIFGSYFSRMSGLGLKGIGLVFLASAMLFY